MRLLLEGRLDALRAAVTTTHAGPWRRLLEQCDWYRTQQPPAEHPTASITYFGPAAANLSLAYLVSGERAYLSEAVRWIDTAVAYPHWGKAKMPDHDLDAGWLLHGLSLAYSWLGDDLGADRAAALRAKLELQGRRLFDFAVRTEGTWWSSSYWQNHNWICYAGLATAGYVLGRPAWTDRARDNFALVLDALPVDGSDHEGVVYWRYGVPWLAIYLDLLQHAEGLDWWHRSPFLGNTVTYRLHQSAPGWQTTIDHGDCHDRRSGHSIALYRKLAGVYRNGTAQWLADLVADDFYWREALDSGVRPGVRAEAFLDLLWYDPAVPAVPVTETTTPTRAYFPDLGLVAARTGWGPDAHMVSFKASPGGGHHAWATASASDWQILSTGHHHPDSGSFVYLAHGGYAAVEDGYNNAKRAEHHNVVLVDGHGFRGDGRYDVYAGLPAEHQAHLFDVVIDRDDVRATADLTALYDPALRLRKVWRTFVFTARGALIIRDELEADEPHVWTVLLHTDWPLTGDRIWTGTGHAYWHRHEPADAVVEAGTTPIEANPTGSTPSLKITKTLYTLRTSTLSPCTSAVFVHTLAPWPDAVPGAL